MNIIKNISLFIWKYFVERFSSLEIKESIDALKPILILLLNIFFGKISLNACLKMYLFCASLINKFVGIVKKIYKICI